MLTDNTPPHEALAAMSLAQLLHNSHTEAAHLDVLERIFCHSLPHDGVHCIFNPQGFATPGSSPALLFSLEAGSITTTTRLSEELYTTLRSIERALGSGVVDTYSTRAHVRLVNTPEVRARASRYLAELSRHPEVEFRGADQKELDCILDPTQADTTPATPKVAHSMRRVAEGREGSTGEYLGTRVMRVQHGNERLERAIQEALDCFHRGHIAEGTVDGHDILPLDEVFVWQFTAQQLAPHQQRLPESLIALIATRTLLNEAPRIEAVGEKRGMIAYYPSPQKAIRGQLTYAKPGRYLRRVLKEANDEQIKQLSAEMASAIDFEIREVRKASNYRWVYMHGPQSCMSYGESKFDETFVDGEWVHPAEAYAHPDNDISLVYLRAERNGKPRPAARALVNRDTMRYPRIYASDWFGNADKLLRQWLAAEGFSQDDDALEGQKLQRIDLDNGGILCPYIDDGNIEVDVYDDHLLITHSGERQANHETGALQDAYTTHCECCGERWDEDEMTAVGGHAICPSCLEDEYVEAAISARHTEYVRTIDAFELPCTVTPCYGSSTDWAADWISTSDLMELGVVRSQNGDWLDLNDAITHVCGDYVETDECIDEGDSPDCLRRRHEYVIIDGEAHDLEDVFFHEGDACWYVRDDYPLDEAFDFIGDHTYRERDLFSEGVA